MIVESYVRWEVTFESDTLPAISGPGLPEKFKALLETPMQLAFGSNNSGEDFYWPLLEMQHPQENITRLRGVGHL